MQDTGTSSLPSTAGTEWDGENKTCTCACTLGELDSSVIRTTHTSLTLGCWLFGGPNGPGTPVLLYSLTRQIQFGMKFLPDCICLCLDAKMRVLTV